MAQIRSGPWRCWDRPGRSTGLSFLSDKQPLGLVGSSKEGGAGGGGGTYKSWPWVSTPELQAAFRSRLRKR